jgi:hypothetical protein
VRGYGVLAAGRKRARARGPAPERAARVSKRSETLRNAPPESAPRRRLRRAADCQQPFATFSFLSPIPVLP